MRIEPSRKDDRLFNFMCGVVIFLFLWCERALRSRVTLRKEGQVELSGERPKQLSAARCWRASMDGVNPNLWVQRFTEPFCSLNHGGNVVRARTRLLEIASDDFPLLHAGWILRRLLSTQQRESDRAVAMTLKTSHRGMRPWISNSVSVHSSPLLHSIEPEFVFNW
jgi:hypothetical protein